LETTPEGKLHFTIPFDKISAKEAIGLILYGSNPTPIEDAKLIELLQTSWKAVKDNVVRARVSELRKEGKLIAEQGRYSLSGAGIQWISQDVLPKIRPAPT
jgi:DNA-binding transcriptional regulator PaaX